MLCSLPREHSPIFRLLQPPNHPVTLTRNTMSSRNWPAICKQGRQGCGFGDKGHCCELRLLWLWHLALRASTAAGQGDRGWANACGLDLCAAAAAANTQCGRCQADGKAGCVRGCGPHHREGQVEVLCSVAKEGGINAWAGQCLGT